MAFITDKNAGKAGKKPNWYVVDGKRWLKVGPLKATAKAAAEKINGERVNQKLGLQVAETAPPAPLLKEAADEWRRHCPVGSALMFPPLAGQTRAKFVSPEAVRPPVT